ncbi:GntR family transcriptional regulator [Streptosporangium sandarakinum]|uniref:GntR family transcriptional regulator n=1 Tax=Streptosporangium sandarakinum TaxID=1260955 RepID=UPI0036882968
MREALKTTYPPGSLLPSENQLIQEFGVSRPTVVAALRVLHEQGWIESQQGKGRFVRGRPALTSAERPRPGQAYLIAPESASQGEVIEAAALVAPNRIAALLGLEPKGKAFLRRRLVSRGGEPTEMVSLWVPVELSQGTDLTSAEPLLQGLREHLRSRKGVRFDADGRSLVSLRFVHGSIRLPEGVQEPLPGSIQASAVVRHEDLDQ